MMDLSELLTKLMQLGIMVIGILIIIFMFISYSVNVYHEDTERQAYVLGDYLLSSKCLAETDISGNVIKSLLSEARISAIASSPPPSPCINYEKGNIEIKCFPPATCDWNFNLTANAVYENKNAQFVVAVKRLDGSIVPANLTVIL